MGSSQNDTGIPATTIREYYYILEDTFLGFMLPAFVKTQRRKSISTAKFYFFDVGVKNSLAGIEKIPVKSELFGDAFEHFIAMELRAYLSYRRLRLPLSYWRSKSGFEVDFLIGDSIAIEVKATERVASSDLKGLYAFQEEGVAKQYCLVSQDPVSRKTSSGIEIMPWQVFIKRLWQNELVNN